MHTGPMSVAEAKRREYMFVIQPSIWNRRWGCPAENDLSDAGFHFSNVEQTEVGCCSDNSRTQCELRRDVNTWQGPQETLDQLLDILKQHHLLGKERRIRMYEEWYDSAAIQESLNMSTQNEVIPVMTKKDEYG